MATNRKKESKATAKRPDTLKQSADGGRAFFRVVERVARESIRRAELRRRLCPSTPPPLEGTDTVRELVKTEKALATALVELELIEASTGLGSDCLYSDPTPRTRHFLALLIVDAAVDGYPQINCSIGNLCFLVSRELEDAVDLRQDFEEGGILAGLVIKRNARLRDSMAGLTDENFNKVIGKAMPTPVNESAGCWSFLLGILPRRNGRIANLTGKEYRKAITLARGGRIMQSQGPLRVYDLADDADGEEQA